MVYQIFVLVKWKLEWVGSVVINLYDIGQKASPAQFSSSDILASASCGPDVDGILPALENSQPIQIFSRMIDRQYSEEL